MALSEGVMKLSRLKAILVPPDVMTLKLGLGH